MYKYCALNIIQVNWNHYLFLLRRIALGKNEKYIWKIKFRKVLKIVLKCNHLILIKKREIRVQSETNLKINKIINSFYEMDKCNKKK